MQNKSLTPREFLTYSLILLVMPSTILFGIYFLEDRKYYFISLLIIIYIMLPFFMAFEKRKPKARELIIISVLTAIAVAGRTAFFMIPQVKPVAAIVIITGVCFGAEAGFLTGAMTAFVSNFFFGQGPWTPWQMFAFGLIGFLAGILFSSGVLRKNRLNICIFGGLSTLIIYGGIVNLGSLMMYSHKITKSAVIAQYAAGIAFDLVHAASTVVFLFFISNPMTEKLERIRIKYGILKM